MVKGPRQVSGQTTVLTYNYLNEAATFALEQATASELGSFYNCLCSIVMSAFCLEAYINHVGMDRFQDWDDWASPLDKLERVAKELHVEIDFGKRPFQSIKNTNRFRNWMAHGRTDVLPISYTEKRPTRGKVRRAKTRWQSMCTVIKAKHFLEDSEKVVELIHERCGYEGPPFGMLELTYYVKRPENC